MTKSKIYFISGEKAKGKTSCMRELSSLFKEAKIPISGFLSIGYWENDQRSHYNLKWVGSGEEIMLCNRTPNNNWVKGGCYYFNTASVRKGEKLLMDAAKTDKLIFVDEVGRLECKNLIWSNILNELLSQNKNMVWGVRDIYLNEVRSFFGIKNSENFPIDQYKAHEVFNKIRTDIKTGK